MIDAVRFGALVAFVCRCASREYGFDKDDVRIMHGMVTDMMPPPVTPTVAMDALNAAILQHGRVNLIVAHIRDGRKIEAIKEYRALSGVGLKEAKDAVEAMEPHVRAVRVLNHQEQAG